MLIAGTGGFLGTCARFLVNNLVVRIWKEPFPLATFLVNIIGCLIFGIIFGLLQRSQIINPRLNAFLIVGFCGGFTTFSTFSAETVRLLGDSQSLTAFLYVGVSVICGLIAVWFGMLVAK